MFTDNVNRHRVFTTANTDYRSLLGHQKRMIIYTCTPIVWDQESSNSVIFMTRKDSQTINHYMYRGK